MIDRHFHWEFVGYNGEPDAEKIKQGVTVSVIGFMSESDALLAVRDVVQREQFWLHRVWECSQCGFQREVGKTFEKMAGRM